MQSFDNHPTVAAVRNKARRAAPTRIDATELRQWCLAAGADDVGFVNLSRSELDGERDDILRVFPATKSLAAFVCRMNPDSVRSPARNIANHEFHEAGDDVNETARHIVSTLAEQGIRAVNPPMAFPMETERFPEKMWAISLKPLAVAAGLGQMGIHRNVIHPKFGNFIVLGVVLLEVAVSEESRPIDYNPCVNCKLCVAACPVGAISPHGDFNFSSCYAHNYREFMSGFTDWVEKIADSKGAQMYRHKVSHGYVDDPKFIRDFPALDFDRTQVDAMSPELQVTPKTAPTLMIHGDQDTLVPLHHSEKLKTQLDNKNVTNELIVIQDAGHAFLGSDKTRAEKAMLDWFDRHLRKSK
jgi:ferredoxin